MKVRVLFYIGHLRNARTLSEVLRLDYNLYNRRQREVEILKKAYSVWGTEMPKYLSGMFSFALGVGNGHIFCARDHFGLKPLYYYVNNNSFLACPSIDDIIGNSSYEKTINDCAVQNYLSYSYVAGRNTLYKKIFKLLPGESLLWDGRRLSISLYWKPEYNIDNSKSLDEWSQLLHETIKKVVDGIVDCDEHSHTSFLLSGGVDSAYLLGLSDVKQTLTACFFEDEYDEGGLAKETAEFYKRDNAIIRISKTDFLNYTREAIKNLELPIGTPATIAYGLLCKFAAHYSSICLSGEGADEFFCGYDVYKDYLKSRKADLKNYIGKADIMDEKTKAQIMKKYISGLHPTDILADFYLCNSSDPVTKMSDTDMRVWLEGNSFLNTHRMGVSNGVEIRSPLIDLRIFDVVSKMPSKYKVDHTAGNKIVLRNAASKIMPQKIAFRKKSGFVIPMRHWLLSDEYREMVLFEFNSDAAGMFFNKAELVKLYQSYLNGDLDLWKQIWNIFVFLIWYDVFF